MNQSDLVIGWLLVVLAASACPAGARRPQLAPDFQRRHHHNQHGQDTGQQAAKRTAGRIFVVDEKTGHATPLSPGLLDETLLNRGSFSFGTKQVVFNKLKVLGNVYVKNVNGRPLHESYVFKRRRQVS